MSGATMKWLGVGIVLMASTAWAAAPPPKPKAAPAPAAAAKPPLDPAKIPRPAELEKGKGTRILPPAEKERLIHEKETLAAQKRTEAIRLLEELVAMKPGEETMADALFKLAELYWEDARQKYMVAMSAYEKQQDACKDQGDKAPPDCKTAPAPRLDVSRSELLYAQLADRYKKYPRIDVVLYLLGFGAREGKRHDESVKWFQRLIGDYPDSKLLPDAWMMIGEGHFEKFEWVKARAAYAKVLEHRDSPVYDLALFKSAWCDWKLGETKRAAERFKEVLDIAAEAEKSERTDQQKRSIQLREEALQYLTLLFTEDESVTAKDAYDFLAGIGGDRYSREVLVRLSDVFYGQGRYDRAIQAWKFLIALDSKHRDAPRFQMKIVDSWVALDDRDQGLAAAKELARLYGPSSEWAKAQHESEATDKVKADIEETLANLAKRFHGEAQADEQAAKRPDVTQYKRAADLYAFYLSQYADSPRAQELRFLRAEILYFKLNQLEAAGDEYLKVGMQKPIGPRNKDALLKAMAAYEKLRPKDQQGKKRKLTAADGKFAEAVDAFATAFPADREVVGVIFRNGQMFFDYGDYDNAVKRFGLIVTKYPDDPNAGAAGDRILEALAKGEDYDNIEDWAKKLKGARAFQVPSEQKRLDDIIAQAISKIAEKQVKAQKFQEAADTFIRAAKEYPQDKRAPHNLFSAGVVLETAAQPVRAAETYLVVVDKYPGAPDASKAAFAAGRTYEQMAYFDKAAEAYSTLAYKYPTDAKAQDALFNVAVLRQALGDTKAAIQATNDYAKRYPRAKDVSDIEFRTGSVYADAGEHGRAVAAFQEYVRKNPQSPRAVEAWMRIGREYLAQKQGKKADEALAVCIKRWKQLARKAQKDAAPAAAEARYLQGEFLFQSYQAVGLDVKPNQLKATLERKKQLLGKAQQVYTDVVSYGDPTWGTASLLRIGQIYEGFADQLRKLPPPPGLTEEEQQVYREQVDIFVVDIEDKAAAVYETGYKKALELKVYGNNTRMLREGLGRLSETKYPPERESRQRTRLGDKPPEPPILKDVGGDE